MESSENVQGSSGKVGWSIFEVLSTGNEHWELSSKQTMTETEHNRPIPKFFSNRPSASAAEVFGLLIGH